MLKPPHEKTLERQREVTDLFRVRGDAALTLLVQVRDDLKKQVDNMNIVIDMIERLDGDIGINKQHINMSLISVLRDRFPEKTEGLSDEEVSNLIAGGLK